MELDLGLALSKTPLKVPILEELDLISYVNCEAKQVFDCNSSTLSSQSSVNDGDYGEEEINNGFFYMKEKKKRGFDEAFEVESSVFASPKTLPLLLWDKHPNEDENNPKRLCKSSSFTTNKNEDDSIVFVGWPPIKSYRKKLNETRRHRRHCQPGHRGGNFPAMYVKVQMEGFLITRKIDLKLYHSYEALTCTLLTMFGKGLDSVNGYKLTYQDREGDWLLAQDVPWSTFIQSVQRLKMLRREGSSN